LLDTMGGKDRTLRWPWRRAEAVDIAALQAEFTDLVYGYAFVRLRSHAEAEDVTVEVFAAVLTGKRGASELPRAYLLGIARRKVADRLRLRERRKETPLEETHALPDASAQGLLEREAAAKLREVIDGLRPDYREALLLKYVEGLSLTEIGRVLGKTPAQVGSVLQQAREAARRRGRDYFEENR
jgi:RNA polymerase sigma-70 factor, ECF subfamily